MNAALFVAAAVAGGLGAGLRYAADVLLSQWMRPPWGVLIVNVVGSFALGVLTGIAPDAATATIIGGGLLGGFTTFSAVSVTSVLLAEEGRNRMAIMNSVGTFVLAVLAAWVGISLGGLWAS